ncbi:MAG: hypothetical protein JWR77_1315, partial [Rhizorhabdus sp.]|nr:hypothetical protein [Rhizorhabdus sp.]
MEVGGELLVNGVTSGHQWASHVAGLAGGGYVVTWADDSGVLGDPDYAVAAQIFDADGQKVGDEFRVNSETGSLQFYSDVTALSDGGFVVTWDDNSGIPGNAGSDIKAQI